MSTDPHPSTLYAAYLRMLRAYYNPVWMPRVTPCEDADELPQSNRHPFYKSAACIEALTAGAGTYIKDPAYYDPTAVSFVTARCHHFGAQFGNVQVLTNLVDRRTFGRSRASATAAWGRWCEWTDRTTLPIDLKSLEDELRQRV